GELHGIAAPLRETVHEAREAALWLASAGDPNDLGAGAYAFLQLVGLLAMGWMWLRLAETALPKADDPFCAAKLVTARHFAVRSLPEAAGLRRKVEAGSETLMALSAATFLRD